MAEKIYVSASRNEYYPIGSHGGHDYGECEPPVRTRRIVCHSSDMARTLREEAHLGERFFDFAVETINRAI